MLGSRYLDGKFTICISVSALFDTIHMKLSLNNQSNKSYCFQLLYMILAIDIADGRSNKVCCELLFKKYQGRVNQVLKVGVSCW